MWPVAQNSPRTYLRHRFAATVGSIPNEPLPLRDKTRCDRCQKGSAEHCQKSCLKRPSKEESNVAPFPRSAPLPHHLIQLQTRHPAADRSIKSSRINTCKMAGF